MRRHQNTEVQRAYRQYRKMLQEQHPAYFREYGELLEEF